MRNTISPRAYFGLTPGLDYRDGWAAHYGLAVTFQPVVGKEPYPDRFKVVGKPTDVAIVLKAADVIDKYHKRLLELDEQLNRRFRRTSATNHNKLKASRTRALAQVSGEPKRKLPRVGSIALSK